MSRKLIERVPKYYRNSKVMAHIFSTDEVALDEAEAMLEVVDAQCAISTADVSLGRWERIYGIPASHESDERRRERLLARKRGYGTITVEKLKNVISSFSNGEVDITEYYDQYLIAITFLGEYGLPPYLDDVVAAIEEIIPAHLAYTFVFIYHVWSEVSAKLWSDIAEKTWKEISEGEL